MNKKTILGAVLCLAISGMSINTFAMTKEENVYVKLDNNGEIDNAYVVNSFLLDEDREIIDYGKYKDLRNLSGSDEILYENGKVTLKRKKWKELLSGNIRRKRYSMEYKY